MGSSPQAARRALICSISRLCASAIFLPSSMMSALSVRPSMRPDMVTACWWWAIIMRLKETSASLWGPASSASGISVSG